MTKITFELDGKTVEAEPGETIWQVAQAPGHDDPASVLASGARLPRRRQLPRLHGRGRGRARAGRLLPAQGRRRHEGEDGSRAGKEVARDGVRAADGRPARAREDATIPSPSSGTGSMPWASRRRSRFRAIERHVRPTCTHSAIAVNLDACINCGLCVRACREVQINDVIGMAYPRPRLQGGVRLRQGHGAVDLRRLRRVRAGVPDRRADGEEPARRQAGKRVNYETESVDTLCPYCGVGCQTTVHVKDNKILYVDGRDGPANDNRLCVKGRFGFDYIHHPDRLTKPLIRRDGVAKDANMQIRREEMAHVLPRGDLGGGARPRPRRRPEEHPRDATAARRSPASARPRAPTRKPICSRS